MSRESIENKKNRMRIDETRKERKKQKRTGVSQDPY